MTVRALAGLAALNFAYALVGPLAPLGDSSRFARGAACSGSRGSGTCSASRRSACSGRRSSSRASRSAVSRSWSPWSSSLRPAGRRPASRSRASSVAFPESGATPILLVSAAGIALAGLFLEALFRAGAPEQPAGVRRLGVLGAEGRRRSSSSTGSTQHVFTTAPNASYPPLQPDPRRGGLPRDGRRRRRHAARAVLVPRRRRRRRRSPGCLHRHAPAWLLWPPLLLVLVVPRFGERLLAPQGDVLLDILVAVAALLVALWLRDRRGWRLAAAAVLLAGAVNTKREGILFAAGVLAARVRRLATAAMAAARRAHRSSWRLGGAALADLDRRGTTSRRGAPSSLRHRPVSGGALRLSFDVLYSNARWSVLPVVATIALGAAAVWGDRRLAAYVGLLARPPLRRRRLVDGRLPRARDQRRRVREPDRALHGVADLPRGRRRSLAAGVGLAKTGEEP